MELISISSIEHRHVGRLVSLWGKVSRVGIPKWVNKKTMLECQSCGHRFKETQKIPYEKIVLPLRCPSCDNRKSACDFQIIPDLDGAVKLCIIELITKSTRFKLVLLDENGPQKGEMIQFEVKELQPNMSRKKSSTISSWQGESDNFISLSKDDVKNLEKEIVEENQDKSSGTVSSLLDEGEYEVNKILVRRYWAKGDNSANSLMANELIEKETIERITDELGISFRDPKCSSCNRRDHNYVNCPDLVEREQDSDSKRIPPSFEERITHAPRIYDDEITLAEWAFILSISLAIVAGLFYFFIL